MPDAPDFSFVVPAYNEEASIEILAGEIHAAMETIGGTYEIVWVDDGSSDGTTAAMKRTAEQAENVHIVRLGRNMGKSEAYTRGFARAAGRRVVTLDADLQDDPAELPKLLAVMEEGFDLVVGRKLGRMGNEPRKKLVSYPFNLMLRVLFGLQLRDTNSGFRVMRREVAKSLELYGDLYRFIPQISHMNGFLVTECGVIHRKRTFGKSKYGVSRFWTGLLDLVTVAFLGLYVKKPLHFFATLGAAFAVIGVSLELYVLISKLSGNTFQQHVAAIVIGAMLITLSVQLFMSGVLADMLASQHRMIQDLRRTKKDQ
ncbi:glycosyltransferase involved in cell wall biosynthesis [Rhodovulum iodosum]|uniref:Glycosyltransferase involved in cell wall biosynthesis n=1 Tax=Rhodovulum iodosum TaxID=68291 RepID=A0ABV3XSR2_9RHOB|nr:glycosyltransferase family 2 protein [Rhodovulum robiginosum]RSK30673.1 glycosyltransferase [Rhodovulum robiginosum]